jgi:cytochrome c5
MTRKREEKDMSGRRLAPANGLLFACLVASAGLLHAQPAATAPATDPDRQLVETMCSTCHPITQVTSKTKTPDDWAATVDKMIGLGAPVTEEDRDRIIAYLATHQAPPTKP